VPVVRGGLHRGEGSDDHLAKPRGGPRPRRDLGNRLGERAPLHCPNRLWSPAGSTNPVSYGSTRSQRPVWAKRSQRGLPRRVSSMPSTRVGVGSVNSPLAWAMKARWACALRQPRDRHTGTDDPGATAQTFDIAVIGGGAAGLTDPAGLPSDRST
jgi:hypothetical protein